jgi:prolyl oligopeptidase
MSQRHLQSFLDKLEFPLDDTALHWVAEQNDRTMKRFTRSGRFQEAQQTIQQSLNDQANIPWGEHYHDIVYNFWQDDNHPRGIWRRTHETSYLTAEPKWETVLDIDRLNEEEGANWSYRGVDLLYPDFKRALVFLSSGGDACEIREFDLIEKKFVCGGFFLPESKSSATWLDENHLLLALDMGGKTLTASGYPRCVSRWQRGTLPQDAALIYTGEVTDVAVSAWYDYTSGFEKTLVRRMRNFYHSQTFHLNGQGKLVSIDIPEDASCGFFNAWLLVKLTTAWRIGDKTYPPGALLATDFASFQQGLRNFTILFMPDEYTTLQGYSSTRDYLILNLTQEVVGRVEILTTKCGLWNCVQTLALPDFTAISASGIDTESNRYQLVSYGFLQPCCLSYGDLDNKTLSVAKQAPACFDKTDFEVSQHFARSLDGTRIPYFQIATKGLELTGKHPTLLYGYGGFGVSLTPEYLGAKGITWLQKGGVYIVANIRGGGEYGPEWHQAALQQHRHRAFEDFVAVAMDLVSRRVTCADRLAAQGASNGGLLIGNMLTDYPKLFGALLCEVPLLDMTNYHRWLAGASWITEYGDPNIAEELKWLRNYSPFDKVSSDKTYPPVLFITGTKDDRVSPAHARKMVARMLQQGHNNVWLYENTDTGHGRAPENCQVAFYHAMTEEFLWQMLIN